METLKKKGRPKTGKKPQKRTVEYDKRQIDLTKYGAPYKKTARYHVFLPCSGPKPYKLSTTHSYVNKKLKEGLSHRDLKKVQVNTISEIIGIIPEHLEDIVFNYKENYYEQYPDVGEGDIERTAKWLADFVLTDVAKSSNNTYLCYATSTVFRKICQYANKIIKDSKVKITLLPKTVNKNQAIFEFRRLEKIAELIDHIKA